MSNPDDHIRCIKNKLHHCCFDTTEESSFFNLIEAPLKLHVKLPESWIWIWVSFVLPSCAWLCVCALSKCLLHEILCEQTSTKLIAVKWILIQLLVYKTTSSKLAVHVVLFSRLAISLTVVFWVFDGLHWRFYNFLPDLGSSSTSGTIVNSVSKAWDPFNTNWWNIQTRLWQQIWITVLIELMLWSIDWRGGIL